MPSLFTLEGPTLGADVVPQPKLPLSFPRWLQFGAMFVFGAAGVLIYQRARKGRPLFGLKGLGLGLTPRDIARESSTVEDYARRVEAWNSSEAKPVPIEKLAKLYPKVKPATVKRLINEAREAREEGRERLWSRAARGLRGAKARALVEVRSELKKLGVDEMISERDDAIHVGKIVVPKGSRGGGTGTRAMQLLVEYADKTGKRITLTPSTDFGASSVARLKKFYKRFGFVENKGRNKDYTIRETMFRPPTRMVMGLRGKPDLECWELRKKLQENLDNWHASEWYHWGGSASSGPKQSFLKRKRAIEVQLKKQGC